MIDALGCFENHRQMSESRIVDQVSERLQPHLADPDPRVPINAAAALAAAIIQVPRAEAARTHGKLGRAESIVSSYSSLLPSE